jgi:hypothetical protein
MTWLFFDEPLQIIAKTLTPGVCYDKSESAVTSDTPRSWGLQFAYLRAFGDIYRLRCERSLPAGEKDSSRDSTPLRQPGN